METMNDNSYPICENCIFVNESIDNDPCRECIMAFLAQRIKPNFVSKYKPVTNGDRIRAMTDEELAEWFYHIQDDISRFYDSDHAIMPDLPCGVESWLDWIKQEAME